MHVKQKCRYAFTHDFYTRKRKAETQKNRYRFTVPVLRKKHFQQCLFDDFSNPVPGIEIVFCADRIAVFKVDPAPVS